LINNLEKYIKKEIKQVKYNVTFEKIHYVLIDEYLYKETGNKFAKVFRLRGSHHVSSVKQGLLPEWQEVLKDGKKNIGLLVISSGSNSKKSFHLLKMPDDLESKIMKSHNDLYLVLLQVLESISASEILGLWYFIKGSRSNEMEIIEDMMSEGI
jgi:hypothetical protein